MSFAARFAGINLEKSLSLLSEFAGNKLRPCPGFIFGAFYGLAKKLLSVARVQNEP